MNKTISAVLDHCTLMNADLQTSAKVFFPLGFVGDGNCSALSEQVVNAFVPSVRFVFDNAYLECAQFPDELEMFARFRTSDAGMHMVTMLTDSAERFRNALIAEGREMPAIEVTEREGADHGENKGKAVFYLAEVPGCAIPDTHMAYLEHRTRELLYQPGRYAHPNTADTFEELVLCTSDAALAGAIEAQLTALDETANTKTLPGGMRTFRIVDESAFKAEFGYDAGAARNIFSAVVFGVSNLNTCRGIVEKSGLRWHEENGTIYVDATGQVSLVICFRAKTV